MSRQAPAPIATRAVSISQTHTGPLPAPSVLADYVRSGADFPNRIVVMAEQEQLHRHGIEKYHLEQLHRRTATGQYLGFGVSVASMLVSAYLAYLGHPVEAAAFGGANLVALVSVFVVERRAQATQTPKNE